MRTITKIEGGAVVSRDYSVTLKRQGTTRSVISMFDNRGSEVFDPTEAVEVDVGGKLLELVEGDVLTVSVEV